MLRSSVVGVVVATLGAAGVVGATVIRGHAPRASRVAERTAPMRETERQVSVAQATPTAPAQTPSQNPNVSSGNVAIAPAVTKPIARPTVAATRPATPLPVLPQGRSDLPDGISAMRTDSVVVLNFDTKLARTRIPEKFERFVRATLPTIYGASADSALARIPQGALAGQGDLINELPARGMRIPVTSGWMITLYPITRPGQDGPLVTRYRVMVVKG